MGAIKKAFKSIGEGIEKAVKSVGQIAKGIATLDLKAAAQGVKGLVNAGADLARGMINLTPAALAANKLLDGALDKVLKKAQSIATKVTDAMVDNVEGGLSNIKNGLVNTVKGLAKGDIKQVLNGVKDLAMGVVETASNFGPGGVAKNVARLAVDAVVDMAVEKTTQAAAKVLDPNGTSKVGGMMCDALGAAAGAAAGGAGSRVTRDRGGFDGPDRNACGTNTRGANAPGADVPGQKTSFRESARQEVRATRDDLRTQALDAAEDMAQNAIQMAVDELMQFLTQQLNSGGNSHKQAGLDIVGNTLGDAASNEVSHRRNRYEQRSERNNDAHCHTSHQHNDTQRTTGNQRNENTQRTESTQRAEQAQELRASRREIVESAVSQTLDYAIQLALDAALRAMIDNMSPSQQKALAALAGEGLTPQALRHGMQQAIEQAVLKAVEKAVGTMTDAVMQAIQDPSKASDILKGAGKKVLEDSFDQAIKEAVSGVADVVADTAAKAEKAGLGEEIERMGASFYAEKVVLSTVQTANELRIRA